MLISHRYRFIYTKTAKTAGTSVESYFERFCMPDGAWEQLHGRQEYINDTGVIGFRGPKNKKPDDVKWWSHMPASDIKRLIGQDIWESYYKFCVIRNPFEKCISAFCHLGKNYGLNNININSEQERFYNYVKDSAPVDRNKYLINDDFCLDEVIRFESLESDINLICQRIGIPFDKEYIPKFKSQARSPDITIESLYTEKSLALVKEKFAFELDHFGYEVPVLKS